MPCQLGRYILLLGFMVVLAMPIRLSATELPIDPRDQPLLSKLSSTLSEYDHAVSISQRYPAWSINGDITNRDFSKMIIWGKAMATSDSPPSDLGWQIEDGNIIVIHPTQSGIIYQKYFGTHYFIGTTYVTNAFGANLPCKVYGDFPASYYAAQTQQERLRSRLKVLARTLEASVVKSCRGAIGGNSADSARYEHCAVRCLAVGSILARHGLDSGVLEGNAVIFMSDAATVKARTGNLDVASTFLRRAFSITMPDTPDSNGLSEEMINKLFHINGGNANDRDAPIADVDSGSDGRMAVGMSNFATGVYESHPNIAHQLLTMWVAHAAKCLTNKSKVIDHQDFSRQLMAIPHSDSDNSLVSQIQATLDTLATSQMVNVTPELNRNTNTNANATQGIPDTPWSEPGVNPSCETNS